MAEISVDTSSYPKPAIPTSPLDIAGKLGTLQSQKLDIDQKKLDQANQALTYLSRGLNSLGPNATKDQLINMGKNIVNMGLAPPQMAEQMERDIRNTPDADMPKLIDRLQTQTADHQQVINHFRGQQSLQNTGANNLLIQTPGSPNYPPIVRGSIPVQAPPTFGVTQDNPNLPNYGGTRNVGQQPPPETPGFTNRLRAVPPPLPAGPLNPAMVPGMRPGEKAISAQAMPATGSFPTTLPPGAAEAENVAGTASGAQLAQDRSKASTFQREIFPLAQAIPALESLGTKGTGPGTETINHLKSFILSNIPGVKESDFNGTVADYDKAKKYLTDFVNQSNLPTKSVDGLAASFAGNPSVGISNAATVDVAKSALALRRMQQALYHEFEQQNLPANQYSKWVAKRVQETDPRAFGIDLMDEAKVKKLKASFANQVEANRFEQSLNLAQNLGFLTPSK